MSGHGAGPRVPTPEAAHPNTWPLRRGAPRGPLDEMIGKLIVSHGRLAEELLAAARAITGEVPGFRALALEWAEGSEEATERIGREIEALDDGHGVLILTDMFGDTPCNAALSHCRPGRVELVSGVNLPMVVRLAWASDELTDVQELADWIIGKGRASIRAGEAPSRTSCGSGGGTR